MKIFAIADTHLSLARPKPMDIFSPEWKDHWDKIKTNWYGKINDEDIVLLPGDLSWALKLEDAKVDIDAICAMPGKKILLRGNHDYWWNSLNKVNSILSNNTFAIQNSAIKIENVVIAGTRGWISPGFPSFSESDQKIFAREAHRLSLSLQAARDLMEQHDELVLMTHFPPFNEKKEDNIILDQIIDSNAVALVHGHLHGNSINSAFNGNWKGVEMHLVSCDSINFDPKLILEI